MFHARATHCNFSNAFSSQITQNYNHNEDDSLSPCVRCLQKCYDECADFWRQLLLGLKFAMDNLNTLKPKTVYSQYWGTAQRFFLQVRILCLGGVGDTRNSTK
jgi:hypothetical protein